MKSVIRVQDKHGRGMFQYGNISTFTSPSVYDIPELDNLAQRHLNFPNLWFDKKLVKFLEGKLGKDFEAGTLEYRFAFKNLDQFEEWVLREEVAVLNEYGYRVYKIETDDFKESDFQVLFNVNSIKSVTDITDLFLW
jgi:hypothetical protein